MLTRWPGNEHEPESSVNLLTSGLVRFVKMQYRQRGAQAQS